MSSAPKIRILSFLTKHPDLSYEQFYHQQVSLPPLPPQDFHDMRSNPTHSWEYIHAPLVGPWALKHGLVNYTQLQTPPQTRDLGRSGEGGHPSSLAYDGVAIFDLASLAALERAFEDPYYRNVIARDEAAFLRSRKDVPRTMGEPRPVILDGRLLVESGGEVMGEWRRWEEMGKEKREE